MTDEPQTTEPDEAVDDTELFPMGSLSGDQTTAQSLVRRGSAVEVTASLRKAEVPMVDGLLNPDKAGRVLVSFTPGPVHYVPQRDEGKVTGWKLRQELWPTFVQHANDEEAVIVAEFQNLLQLDAQAAGRLIDTLSGMASEVLATA